MRCFKSSVIIFLVLSLNIPFNLFTQSTELDSSQRGVRVLAKDKQTGQEKSVHLYKKVYGVIIGIDLYQNLSPDQQLRYPVKDAKGIEKLLRDRFVFDEIIPLYDKDASRDAIMSTLGKLKQTDFDDAVFIFFAGHGYTDTTQYGELGYLVPYDGSFEKQELYKNISMTQLKEDVGKTIPAKHIFFMIDACYSGLLVTRGNATETNRDLNYLQKITKESVRQVLTAGGKDEKVLDGGPLGHSVFLGRIIQILNETSDFITASELSVKVKENVFSDAMGIGHSQTPAFGKLWGEGDFVFIPKVDTRYEEVRAEISKLQSQLEEIEKQKKEAERIKSEKEIREAKLKEEDIRIKLKLQQVESERLQKEKDRKTILEEEEKKLADEEIQKRIELENRKKIEEDKLKKLRQKLTEEDLKLKDIRKEILSVEAAKKEIVGWEDKINAVNVLITTEKEKAIKQLNVTYNILLEKQKSIAIPPKDQFETTADYENRLKRHDQKILEIMQNFETESTELANSYDTEYELLIKPYREQIEILRNKKYPIEGLKAELLSYNPDCEIYLVCLIESKEKRKYYSLKVEPETAKKMYERKELIKVEGYFKELFDDRLDDVFIIDPIAGKFPLLQFKPILRPFFISITVSVEEAIDMLKKKGLFDAYNNPNVTSKNCFEQLTINGEKVILDFSTGLMWHQSGSPRYHNSDFFSSSISKAKKWLKKLNENGYAGYKDWRIPTLEEAASLLTRVNVNSNLYINQAFSNEQYLIFTGDAETVEKGFFVTIWIVDFRDGRIKLFNYAKEVRDYYFRPVRLIN